MIDSENIDSFNDICDLNNDFSPANDAYKFTNRGGEEADETVFNQTEKLTLQSGVF